MMVELCQGSPKKRPPAASTRLCNEGCKPAAIESPTSSTLLPASDNSGFGATDMRVTARAIATLRISGSAFLLHETDDAPMSSAKATASWGGLVFIINSHSKREQQHGALPLCAHLHRGDQFFAAGRGRADLTDDDSGGMVC